MRPSPVLSPSDAAPNRRTFLKQCGALAGLSALPAWFVQAEAAAAATTAAPISSPNSRPRIALVGCGGMGVGDAINASAFGDIVAVCDVDDTHAAAAVQKFTVDGKAPASFSDFRKVLDNPDVDLIINATPDHWHTLINLGAAAAKKDVYSEKPLTLTVAEGREVVTAVQRHGIILQTGTQQRSFERFRLACEAIRNGRIGTLKQVKVWLPAGLRAGPFSPPTSVPSGLNWDFWLGPAPRVDYVTERCHRTFRFWYDYSGGTITDWGAHHIDIASWAIGLDAPERVSGKALAHPIPGGYDAISEYEIRYEFKNGVTLTVVTTRDDDIFGGRVNPEGQRNGIHFEGTDGWIWVNRSQLTASDLERLRTPLPADAIRLYSSNNHMGNFIESCRTRKAPICDAETGHRSASLCHLGVIALRTGKTLSWDAQHERFTGSDARQANRYLSREPRSRYNKRFLGLT